MAPARPRILLFDLGGVLVEWAGVQPLIDLSGGKLDAETARKFWIEAPWARRLETGSCTPEEFARGVIAGLGLNLTVERFLEAFLSWDRGPMPGSLELLDALRQQAVLACLTNNNVVHWEMLCRVHRLDQRFHRCFVSYLMGLMKPDIAAYRHVIEALDARPGEILFFDDNPECTQGAEAAGIPALCVKGPKAVKDALRNFGFECPP